MRLVHTDEEEINLKDKKFIDDLKDISIRNLKTFIVFDKKDTTLKIDIDKVEIKKLKKEFYSKVDAKINDRIKPEEIICMFKHIPKHLDIRLEADNTKQIIELMKCKTLIEKLKIQRTKFLHKAIKISPRIIKSKMDEDDLKNEVKEKEAKRDRLNMDCDK